MSAELADAQTSSTSKESSPASSGRLANVSSETAAGEAAGDTTSAQPVSSRSTIPSGKYLQPEREPTSGPDLTPGAKPFARRDSGRGEQDGENGEQNERVISELLKHAIIVSNLWVSK